MYYRIFAGATHTDKNARSTTLRAMVIHSAQPHGLVLTSRNEAKNGDVAENTLWLTSVGSGNAGIGVIK